MHTDNRGVDHLDSGIMGSRKRIYDTGPDASPPPTDEAVVARSVRTEVLWQVAPWRPGSQDPEGAIEDTTVIHSRHAARLIRQHRLNGKPLIVREFVAHDSALSVGWLESWFGRQAQLVAMHPKADLLSHLEFCRS